MKRDFRKPLVVVGPKTLLRHAKCLSTYEDMGPNTKFQEVLGYKNNENIRNCDAIIFCSGKFVYDILGQMDQKKS